MPWYSLHRLSRNLPRSNSRNHSNEAVRHDVISAANNAATHVYAIACRTTAISPRFTGNEPECTGGHLVFNGSADERRDRALFAGARFADVRLACSDSHGQ